MKVEINHLTKVIQGNVVLDDINACFSCASGENGGRIYGIQGINGSGKTMLISVVVGFPSSSVVSIVVVSGWVEQSTAFIAHIVSRSLSTCSSVSAATGAPCSFPETYEEKTARTSCQRM